jgi:hypothetical protein
MDQNHFKEDVVMYTESKRILDNIRNEAGEPLFRMAVTHAISVGFDNLTQEAIDETCDEIMKSEEKPMAIMTNEYKCEILRVAGEIAKVSPVDAQVYINREMEFGTEEDYIHHSRLLTILRNALDYIYDDTQDKECFCRVLDRELGIDDDEIEELGFGWVMKEGDEE